MFDLKALGLRRLLQFTLIHVGTAMTVVPVTSVLNRIMIAELGISSTLVAFLATSPYLLSPLQVWFGAAMDRQVGAGGRFVSWIRFGGLLASLGAGFMAFTVFMIPDGPDRFFSLGFLLTCLVFLVWGVGINLASVAYLSLLSAQMDADERSRTIGIMFTAMIGVSIGTGIFLSSQLDPYSQERLTVLLIAVPALALFLVLLGGLGLERKSVSTPVAGSEESTTRVRVGVLLRSLKSNPIAMRFLDT